MCSAPKPKDPPPAPPPPAPFLPPVLGDAQDETAKKKKRRMQGPSRLQIPLGGFENTGGGLGLPTGSTGIRG